MPGMCRLPCSHKSIDMELILYTVCTIEPAVFGLRACIGLKLIELALSVPEKQQKSDQRP